MAQAWPESPADFATEPEFLCDLEKAKDSLEDYYK
jgi:hypothetical protein